jgi:hypothetical protein
LAWPTDCDVVGDSSASVASGVRIKRASVCAVLKCRRPSIGLFEVGRSLWRRSRRSL